MGAVQVQVALPPRLGYNAGPGDTALNFRTNHERARGSEIPPPRKLLPQRYLLSPKE